MPQYRGDAGLFRKCLHETGFKQRYQTIFNDDSKDHTRRRLKLWFGQHVFDAPQAQQKKLERKLKKAFGGRVLAMYFAPAPYGSWSLCIKLQG